MKVIVAVKRVVDYNVKVRVKSDNSGVDIDNVKMSMNPFDEIAVEEAIRLKESGKASEIIIVSVGTQKSEDVIRTALAMGADRGILVETDLETQPLSVAKIIKSIAEKEKPEVIFLGKQAIDDDFNQTGQMISALLDWPQAVFASEVTIENGLAKVEREIDTGSETIEVDLPAVITSDLRLNEPRYPTLPNIMKARAKPIDKKNPEDYGIDISPKLKTLKVEEPPKRKAGIKVETVSELIEKLKSDGAL